MDNKYETIDMVKIAEFLKLRRNTQKTTVLLLGSRTGSLFRSSFLYDTLHPFHTGIFDRISHLQRFAACFHILKTLDQRDRCEILRAAFNQVNIAEADSYVALLAKRGFFSMLVTTNIDDVLEQAFTSIGLKELRDFAVFTGRSTTPKRNIRYTGAKASFTLLKAFGDIAPEDYSIDSRVRHLESVRNLNKSMDDMRNLPILIVGLDPTWDQHIMPRLFPRNGTVWYVNEDLPPEDSLLADQLQECKAQCILGLEGQYERFFHDLSNLIGDSDAYRSMSQSGPLVLFEDVERTVILHQSLEERAEEIRSQGPFPPTSLTVTAHRLYSYVPSGVSACYDAQTMPLIKYEIKNGEPKAVTVVLTAEIQGFSHPHIDTVEVPAQSPCFFHYQLPRLDREKVCLLTKTTLTFVHIRISYLKGGVEFLYNKQDFEIHLTTRNIIRWVVPDIVRRGCYVPVLKYIAAWVTPRSASVRAMLRYAIDYHPQKALVGYPAKANAEVPRSQIKAIFQALKKVGKIAFSNSPFVVGSGSTDRLQTIRLPDESLREHQANCIDGAVLYASLIECALLQPVIVIQAKHAFVGWKTGEDATSYEFLETTMTLSHSFEQAYAAGMESHRRLRESGLFTHEPFDSRDFACLLDIKMLHDSGIFPLE